MDEPTNIVPNQEPQPTRADRIEIARTLEDERIERAATLAVTAAQTADTLSLHGRRLDEIGTKLTAMDHCVQSLHGILEKKITVDDTRYQLTQENEKKQVTNLGMFTAAFGAVASILSVLAITGAIH